MSLPPACHLTSPSIAVSTSYTSLLLQASELFSPVTPRRDLDASSVHDTSTASALSQSVIALQWAVTTPEIANAPAGGGHLSASIPETHNNAIVEDAPKGYSLYAAPSMQGGEGTMLHQATFGPASASGPLAPVRRVSKGTLPAIASSSKEDIPVPTRESQRWEGDVSPLVHGGGFGTTPLAASNAPILNPSHPPLQDEVSMTISPNLRAAVLPSSRTTSPYGVKVTPTSPTLFVPVAPGGEPRHQGLVGTKNFKVPGDADWNEVGIA